MSLTCDDYLYKHHIDNVLMKYRIMNLFYICWDRWGLGFNYRIKIRRLLKNMMSFQVWVSDVAMSDGERIKTRRLQNRPTFRRLLKFPSWINNPAKVHLSQDISLTRLCDSNNRGVKENASDLKPGNQENWKQTVVLWEGVSHVTNERCSKVFVFFICLFQTTSTCFQCSPTLFQCNFN